MYNSPFLPKNSCRSMRRSGESSGALLDTILESDCLRADELPDVPEAMRKPSQARTAGGSLFDFEES